jgi:hypothetical protein
MARCLVHICDYAVICGIRNQNVSLQSSQTFLVIQVNPLRLKFFSPNDEILIRWNVLGVGIERDL